MVSQRFEMVLDIVACPFLNRFENLRMKCDSSGAKQLPISYLTGNRVLERILQLREQFRLKRRSARLQMRKTEPHIFTPNSGHGLKQTKRNDHTDARSCLQNALLLHRQPVDTIRHNVLDGARNTNLIDSQARPVRPLLT